MSQENWLASLILGDSVAHTVFVYALVISLGVSLGKIKICGVSIGIAFVLFAGIACGHFGLSVNEHLLHFVKEFGLILFVFAVGLQVGPSFFSSFKKAGMQMNIAAVSVVLVDVALAIILYLIFSDKISMSMMVGILTGATTNTPSLGAAQEALRQLSLNEPIALGYAAAYPFGVIAAIMALIFLRIIFRVNLKSEAEEVCKYSSSKPNEPHIITIFIGILFGVLLGSIPISFPNMPMPVKLGLAGGPLIVAILIGRFGYKLKLISNTTQSANFIIREIGVCLFLASVGIGAGDKFMETVISESGLLYLFCGFLITLFPLLLVGFFAKKIAKFNYLTLIGILSGSRTNPPLLAYSNSLTASDAPAVGYSTVYPLTMFLRILSAQVLILAFC